MPLCRQAFAVLTILFCALGSAFTSEALALAKRPWAMSSRASRMRISSLAPARVAAEALRPLMARISSVTPR